MVKGFNKELLSYSDGVYRTKEFTQHRIKFHGRILVLTTPSKFAWNGVTGFRTTKLTLIPSLVHDYLIYHQRVGSNVTFTREEIDEIFIILCKLYSVPTWEILLFKAGLYINRNILMKLENIL